MRISVVLASCGVMIAFMETQAAATPISEFTISHPFNVDVPINVSVPWPGIAPYQQTFTAPYTFTIDTFDPTASANRGLVQIKSIDVIPQATARLTGVVSIAVPFSNVFFQTPESTRDLYVLLNQSISALGSDPHPVNMDSTRLPLQFNSLPPAQIEPFTGTITVAPSIFGLPAELKILPVSSQYLSQQTGSFSATLNNEVIVRSTPPNGPVDPFHNLDAAHTLTGINGNVNVQGLLNLKYKIETLQFTHSPQERQKLENIAQGFTSVANSLEKASKVIDIAHLADETHKLATSGLLDGQIRDQLKAMDDYFGFKAKFIAKITLDSMNGPSGPISQAIDTALKIDEVKSSLEHVLEAAKLRPANSAASPWIGLVQDALTISEALARLGATISTAIANDPPNSDFKNPSALSSKLTPLLQMLQEMAVEAVVRGAPAQINDLVGLAVYNIQNAIALDSYERYLGAIAAFDPQAADARLAEAVTALGNAPQNLNDVASALQTLLPIVEAELDRIAAGLSSQDFDHLALLLDQILFDDSDLRTKYLPQFSNNLAAFDAFLDAVLRDININNTPNFNAPGFGEYAFLQDATRMTLSFENDFVPPPPPPQSSEIPEPGTLPILGVGLILLLFTRWRGSCRVENNAL